MTKLSLGKAIAYKHIKHNKKSVQVLQMYRWDKAREKYD
jgi:hypothetical protein